VAYSVVLSFPIPRPGARNDFQGKQQREAAKASARAEKIQADVMRAVAILLADAWTLDELREHVVRRLLALPKEERTRELKRIARAVDTDIRG
jgi:hypothetical protein